MFVAGRIIRAGKGSFSGPIILISIISLVLGLSVMILSVVVLTGFKKEISEKVSGFTGHIHITKYDMSRSLELPPIILDSLDIDRIKGVKGVRHVQEFISKAAILRTDDEIHGLMVKGVNAHFDTSFYHQNLWKGRMPFFNASEKTNEILLSKTIANLLKLDLNDRLKIYFVNNETGQIKGRRWEVVGIYHTSVEEFDKQLLIADIRHLQKINHWENNQVSGLEIFVEDFSEMEQVEAEILRFLIGCNYRT